MPAAPLALLQHDVGGMVLCVSAARSWRVFLRWMSGLGLREGGRHCSPDELVSDKAADGCARKEDAAGALRKYALGICTSEMSFALLYLEYVA